MANRIYIWFVNKSELLGAIMMYLAGLVLMFVGYGITGPIVIVALTIIMWAIIWIKRVCN